MLISPKHPLFWLVGQVLVIGVVFWIGGRFEPHLAPDSKSYINFRLDDVTTALSQSRTVGYPLFLKFAGIVGPSHVAVPLFQFGLHILAVFVFYRGLAYWISSRWTGMTAASTLLYSPVLVRYSNQVLSDSPASSMAILVMGLLMLLIHKSKSRLLWFCLVLAVFATYQTRPAYLFLVLLIPLLGWLLVTLRSAENTGEPSRLKLAFGLSVATVIPLMAFCGIRAILVGHFALVSFGGHGLIGTMGQYLDAQLVAELPDSIQPLAKAAWSRLQESKKSDADWNWDDFGYMAMEQRADRVTYKIFIPAAQDTFGDDPALRNSKLRELAFCIIRARPSYYLIWLAKAFRQGMWMLTSEFVGHPLYLCLIGVLLLSHARFVGIRLRTKVSRQNNGPVPTDSHFLAFNALLLIAVSFAITKLLLIVLVQPPFGRYMEAAGVFLPTVVVVAIAERLHRSRLLVANANTDHS